MTQAVEKALKTYQQTRRKLTAFNYAGFISYWNLRTETQSGSVNAIAEQQSVLDEMSYQLSTSKAYRNAVDVLYNNRAELDEVTAHEITEVVNSLQRLLKIPKKQLLEYSKLLTKSQSVWEEAKQTNNFQLFLPYLEKIIDYNRRVTEWCKTDTLHGYDVLADEYEHGYGVAQYDKFFGVLREQLVPFVKQVADSKLDFDESFAHLTYAPEKQKEFCEYLRKALGFDVNRGIMKESEHPFTAGFGTDLVNITTHYYPEHFEFAIFSAIHETGHALYQQQCDRALNGTFCCDGASMGMHESQSRFYENIIGRSKAFWQAHFDKWCQVFPEQSKGVTVDDMYKFVNKVERSFVRTEADELTYPLHVMLRYEMEQKFIDGSLKAKDARDYWNDAFERYLGIVPPNDTLGILQDIHWAGGSIGYFPTYALGSAISSQIYHAMSNDFDVEQSLLSGTTQKVNEWLKEKVHKFGASKYPSQILFDATGEEFNPQYYVDYLKNKYGKLYGIKD